MAGGCRLGLRRAAQRNQPQAASEIRLAFYLSFRLVHERTLSFQAYETLNFKKKKSEYLVNKYCLKLVTGCELSTVVAAYLRFL